MLTNIILITVKQIGTNDRRPQLLQVGMTTPLWKTTLASIMAMPLWKILSMRLLKPQTEKKSQFLNTKEKPSKETWAAPCGTQGAEFCFCIHEALNFSQATCTKTSMLFS